MYVCLMCFSVAKDCLCYCCFNNPVIMFITKYTTVVEQTEQMITPSEYASLFSDFSEQTNYLVFYS